MYRGALQLHVHPWALADIIYRPTCTPVQYLYVMIRPVVNDKAREYGELITPDHVVRQILITKSCD